jgi:hypothetical protein
MRFYRDDGLGYGIAGVSCKRLQRPVVRFQDAAEMRDIVGSMKEVREAPQAMTATDMIPRLLEVVDPAGAVGDSRRGRQHHRVLAHRVHAGVPNHTGLTPLSLETRTLDDQVARGGAPNDGCACW